MNIDLDGSGTAREWAGEFTADLGDVLESKSSVAIDLTGKTPVIKVKGKTRYGELIADGDARLTLDTKKKQALISFSGTLQTPGVTLKNLQAETRIEEDKTLFVAGKTNTVILNETGKELSVLKQAVFEGTAKILKDKISIGKSTLQTSLFEASAQGSIDMGKRALNLTVQGNVSALAHFVPDLKGAAQGRMSFIGTYEPLALEAPVEINTTEFSMSQSDADALLGTKPHLKAKLSYRNESLTIADGILTGANDQTLTFSGTFKNNQTDLILATHYLDNDLKTNLSIKEDIITFQDVSAQGPVGTISGKAAYDIARNNLQASLALKSDEKTAVSLALFGPVDHLTGKGTLEGEGAFPYRFDFEGALQKIGVRVNSFAGAYGPNKINLKNPADIAFTDNGVAITSMIIGLNDGTFTATGSFGPQNFNADIIAENIPADLEIFPFLFNGRIEGAIALSGSYKNPEGKAQLTLKRIAIPGIEDTQDRYVDGTVKARYKDNILQAHTDLQGPTGLQFNADGNLPLTIVPLSIPFEKPVQATLKSRVDLRALTILLGFDEQRITGHSTLDITLSGTFDKPIIKGVGTLRNGTYDNLLLGTMLKDISADISADTNRLILTSLEGKDANGGRFSGSGHVELRDIQNPIYDFSLDTDHLQLVNLDRMGLTASGNLKSSGDKDQARIKGSIIVNAAEYYIGKIIGTSSLDSFEIVEVNGTETTNDTSEKPMEGPEITLAVNIEAHNNVFVRGPDLETEWSGNLTVSGTTKYPALSGKMNLIRGNFQLLDTPVTLSKGAVSFVNPDPANPIIDVAGTIKGREMDAILKIGGEAQKPQVSVASDPPLPEDEVLAKTLFGKSISQISPVQALRIAQLMAYLSGRKEAGFDPLNKIRRMIGIDTLNVGLDEEKGATLSVGKYINDRVYVGVDQGTTPESSAIRTEIEVTDEIDVETTTGALGESSIGINWKHDY
ncbi:MAG: translocation/assembly module TamB [Rhodospirillales bacterium]|nr:translocation/assembly module TamB [Rhodospirillales bacterium]